MKKYFLFALLTTFSATACSGKKIAPPAPLTQGAVNLQFMWVKDKDKKYDMHLAIINGTDKSILLYLGDLHCYKGNMEGSLKHTFFNTGHRTFKFRAGERGEYNMACNLGFSTDGNYRVTIDKVFENPNGDGKTEGKQIPGTVEVIQAAK